ncbi:sulfite exporter TauE/SafE family protein [Amycolatopsis sp. YIM 10]|uniref:sulfite exporter TauE/SafE family protein n=1 Tax=Amycolatopsis sp. YIM 10 TaxID=2653857 RepID=UPI0012905037|nr:sulfite exporter TauE/SafE family protein [Amycolatopsis sp. YIM 10]
MPELLMLVLAGLAAGALNAVGGGGTFVALPALVAAGLTPVTANAATTVALVPGAAVSAWVFRREIHPVGGTSLPALTSMSVLGSALGAGLLVVLPSSSFDVVVPWLLAFATVVLAFGRPLARRLGTLDAAGGMSAKAVLAGQFLLCVYGGYFGGAVGILMLALWSVGLGLDAAAGNPMRVAQIAAVFLTATVLFLFASDVLDEPVPLLVVLGSAVAGGFAGARWARRLPAWLVRGIVLTTAATMTVLYFVKGA